MDDIDGRFPTTRAPVSRCHVTHTTRWPCSHWPIFRFFYPPNFSDKEQIFSSVGRSFVRPVSRALMPFNGGATFVSRWVGGGGGWPLVGWPKKKGLSRCAAKVLAVTASIIRCGSSQQTAPIARTIPAGPFPFRPGLTLMNETKRPDLAVTSHLRGAQKWSCAQMEFQFKLRAFHFDSKIWRI